MIHYAENNGKNNALHLGKQAGLHDNAVLAGQTAHHSRYDLTRKEYDHDPIRKEVEYQKRHLKEQNKELVHPAQRNLSAV